MLIAWQHEARHARDLGWHRALEREGASADARRQFLFCSALFKIAELQILDWNLKISENKSCRGAIDLRHSQRVTYVLVKGLVGKLWRSCRNSRPCVTVHNTFNSNFCQFILKIGMSANYKNVFPKIMKNFHIGRVWTSVVKFGEHTRKPNQPFRDLGFWPRIWTMTEVFCANVCKIMSNMFMSKLIMINHPNWGMYH
jgi:hypothetical protein